MRKLLQFAFNELQRPVLETLKQQLEEWLLAEHSRQQIDLVVAAVGGDPDRFEMAWEIFCKGAPPLPQRMAWVIDLVTERHPNIAARYVPSIVARIPYMVHPAELRAATKILARSSVAPYLLGELVDKAFQWLMDPQVPAAIRCNAMSILYNVSVMEPDLKPELALVIEAQMQEGGPAIRSRGKKTLLKLQKEMRDRAQKC